MSEHGRSKSGVNGWSLRSVFSGKKIAAPHIALQYARDSPCLFVEGTMKTRRGKRGLEDQTDITSQITFAPPCGTFMHVFKVKLDHRGSGVVDVKRQRQRQWWGDPGMEWRSGDLNCEMWIVVSSQPSRRDRTASISTGRLDDAYVLFCFWFSGFTHLQRMNGQKYLAWAWGRGRSR
jgi:hypothetical protein